MSKLISSYWVNSFYVFLGVCFSQSIPLVGSVFIAKLFLPEDFGHYSSWLAYVVIFAVLNTLRFESLFAVELDEGKQSEIVKNTIEISIFIFFIFFACSLFLLAFSSEKFSIFPSISIAAFFLSLNMIFQSWASARADFLQLTIFRVSLAAFVIGFQLIFGLLYKTQHTLIMGHILGLFLSLLICIFYSPKIYASIFNIKKNLFFIKMNKNFPLFSLPADTLSAVTSSLPVILVMNRFGDSSSGYLALSLRLLAGPLGLMGKAVLDVFKKEASAEYVSRGGCDKIYLQTLIVLSFLSALVFVGGSYFLDDIFLYLYGEEWFESATIAKTLLLLFCFQLISSPLSYVVYISAKQKYDLAWQVLLFFTTLFSFTVFDDFDFSLKVYAAGGSFLYIAYLVMNYVFSRGRREVK